MVGVYGINPYNDTDITNNININRGGIYFMPCINNQGFCQKPLPWGFKNLNPGCGRGDLRHRWFGFANGKPLQANTETSFLLSLSLVIIIIIM